MEAKRELVTRRVQARWDALIKGDRVAAYAYMSPASRATVSLERFKAKAWVGRFRSIKIDSVDCVDDACTVKLWLTYDLPEIKGMRAAITESWIFEDGQAWYVYRE